MNTNARSVLCLFLCMLLLVFSGCSPQTPEPEPETGGEVETEIEREPVSLKDGTYRGVGLGHSGDIVVEVVIADNTIKEVNVVEHNESPNIGDAAARIIPEGVIKYQSLSVDMVSSATYSSVGILKAIEDCIKQAGGEEAVAALRLTPEKEAPAQETEEMEADVVVIGAGISGIAASVKAAQEGARVVLLEKTPVIGGCSIISGGLGMMSYNSKMQLDVGLPVDVDALFAQWMADKNWRCDANVVRRFMDTCGEAADWLASQGMPLAVVGNEAVSWPAQPLPDRAQAYDKMLQGITAGGGAVLLETTGKKLITDANGAVVGVEAEKKDGTKVVISTKAVVIATGGYSGDVEYVKELTGVSVQNRCLPQNIGEGMRMAWEIGAAKPWNLGAQQNHQLAAVARPTQFSLFENEMPKIISYLPCLLNVNSKGVRFRDEGLSRNILGGANSAAHAGGIYYTLLNQDLVDKLIRGGITEFGYTESLRIPDLATTMSDDPWTVNSDIPWTNFPAVLEYMIASGTAYKGETLEELATNAGMDPATLAATFNEYQSYCEAGKDAKFNKDPKNLKKYEGEGPYYLIACQVVTLGSVSSLVVNENMAVLDDNGDPIPGLYAAGAEAMGVIFNDAYEAKGGGLGYSLTSGYIAGIESAAAVKGQ
ncbi:MAG: FAD-dependent oxidoreductase [bacterium]